MVQSRDDFIRWALVLVGLYAFYKIFLEDSKKSTLSLVSGTQEAVDDDDDDDEYRMLAEQPDFAERKPAPNQHKPIVRGASGSLSKATIGGNGIPHEAHRWRHCQGGYNGLNISAGQSNYSTNYHPGSK